MLLHELSTASGVSEASIKYYRREGLLPPGRSITSTRQDYGLPHLDRLALIGVLRQECGASVPDIRALVTLIDDPDVPVVRLLEIAQAIAAGLPAQTHEEPIPRDEDPVVAETIRALGWPDMASVPRAALDRLLRSMRTAGSPVTAETAQRYATVLGELAAGDMELLRRPRPDHPPEDEHPSRDVIVRRAVLGMVSYERLAQVMRALALASVSVAAQRAAESTGPDLT